MRSARPRTSTAWARPSTRSSRAGPPFTGRSAVEVLRLSLDAEPTPLRRLDPTVPRDLEAICLKAMAKDPADRYASALDDG